MKNKTISRLAFMLCGILWVSLCRAGEATADSEPRYLDKPLSRWIVDARMVGELFIPTDPDAGDAVRAIGTNALPWLIKSVQSDNPETARLGIEGLNILGPAAASAMPELLRLVNNWRSSTAWSNAIPALAALRDTNGFHYCLTVLLPAATDLDLPADFRLRVVQVFADTRWRTNTVMAMFEQCLQDPDWRVVSRAADALGAYAYEPATAIPALARCFASHTNVPAVPPHDRGDDRTGDRAIRSSTMSALGDLSGWYHCMRTNTTLAPSEDMEQIREAMRPVVPQLIDATADPDAWVARPAVTALGDMALNPETAVPALIKAMDHPDRAVQQTAIEALGDFGGTASAAATALKKRADSDPDGFVGGPFAAEALKRVMPSDPQ